MSIHKGENAIIHYLPVYGSIATGIIYGAIGVIAMLSLMGLKEGGADESSLLEFLNDMLVGKIFIWIILLGAVAFIIWRGHEAYHDPYQYGSDWKGMGRRIGIGLSSIADAFIAYSALMVMFGTTGIREDGEPEEEQEMAGDMLQETYGQWLVIGIGVIILLTALVQFYYGITQGYRERQDIAHFSKTSQMVMHILAWYGYAARGIIIGIIGFFYMKAGIEKSEDNIVNTDKAFNFLGEEVGAWSFVIVAVGTICYALFMFAQAYTYDVDNQEEEVEKHS
jgi:hypothetical protein